MDFKFTRLERDPSENSERAFIAASRRKDRDFNQRLESLQKASDLHFKRTGRRFEITPTQVAKPGPLMELSKRESKRKREVQRYQPYSYGKIQGGDAPRHEPSFESNSPQIYALPSDQTLKQNTIQPTQTQCEAGEQEYNLLDFENCPIRNNFNDNPLELNPEAYDDGLQTSDNAKFMTTQPQVHVDNKIIEPVLMSGANITSSVFEPKGWQKYCDDAFNAFDAFMDMELFDHMPSQEVDSFPEPPEPTPD